MAKETLRKLVDSLRKKFPDVKKLGLILDDGLQVPQEVFSTGSLALDFRIKYGGIPRAKITQLYGPERSLKTTISLLAALSAIRRHPEGYIVFVDFERNYDTIESREHLAYLGYTEEEMNRIIYIRDVPEEAYNVIETLVSDADCLMVIIDSVVGLMSGKAHDKKFEENQKMGQQPTLIGDMLKRINSRNNNAAIILINQARDNMNNPTGRGPQYIFSGGRTLRHLLHLNLNVNGWHIKEAKDKESANSKINLRATVEKCKVGGEGSQTQIEYSLVDGKFNRQLDCVVLARELGITKNAGGWYYMYDDVNGGTGEVVFRKQGGEAFEKEIMTTPALWQRLEEIILREIGNVNRIAWNEIETQYEEDPVEDEEQEADLVPAYEKSA